MEPSLHISESKLSHVFTFASGNKHGQLYRALGIFQFRGIDLSKLESRPWSSSHPSNGLENPGDNKCGYIKFWGSRDVAEDVEIREAFFHRWV
ncbi:hypothetical protein PsorP6_008628 [Peronosclerospora sorghi]|uniref:Uncharacterized protein n=1 Tax=Peronosclerospora sorghi TaxID=230839 RepID=A0ACC0W9D8_9STRA|nr:hypothetical protein PsorP6_008628 [Peronosclerospora sorghi]